MIGARHLVSRLPFLVLLLLVSTAANAALLSCHAGYGTSCAPLSGDLADSGFFSADNGVSVLNAQTSVDARAGALSAAVSLADSATPGPPSARTELVGANLFAEFDVRGPAGGAPVPLIGLFSFHGTVSANCGNVLACSGSINLTAQVQGADLAVGTKLPSFSATFGAGRSTGSPDLTAYWNGSLDPGATTIDSGSDTALASLMVAVRPGYRIRVDLALGAQARFGNTAPVDALVVADAGNTALFNFILPEGYSMNAVPGFLSEPVLQPVPVPGVAWLMAAVLVAGGRWCRRPRAA